MCRMQSYGLDMMSSSWGKKRRTHHDKRCGNVTKRCVVDLSIAN